MTNTYSRELDELRRQLGAEEVTGDDEPFRDKMQRLTHQPDEQFAESSRLEAVRSNLKGLGYGG